MMQPNKSLSTTIEEDVIQNGEDIADDARVFEGTDVPVKELFYYLEKGYNLHIFLDYFPSVSREQAVEEIARECDRRRSQPQGYHERPARVQRNPRACKKSVRLSCSWR